MNALNYRIGTKNDLNQIMKLAMLSWKRYKISLTEENWAKCMIIFIWGSCI